MVWFLLLLMLTACTANCPDYEDLDGEVLIFPEKSNTDYFKPVPVGTVFSEGTVCFRVKTELCRDHSLLSVATTALDNDFLIFWDHSKKVLQIYVHEKYVEFKDLDYFPNKFHSICVTWEACTGLVQVWFDDTVTTREFVAIGPITDPCVILGQDQDSYCGGFDIHQSFVGEITDLHAWSSIIDVCEIEKFLNYEVFCPGDAINWRNMTYESTGKIVLGPKQICPQDFLQPFPQLCSREDHECHKKIKNLETYYLTDPRYLHLL